MILSELSMKANSICVFLTILIILSACKVNKELLVSLNFEYEIEILKVNNNQPTGLLKPKLFMHSEDTCITFLDNANRLILFWSLTKNSFIDSIDVSLFKTQFIQDYYLISKDTIMLAFNTTYFLMKHDNCVLIIDREKNIIDKMGFSNGPVLLEKNQSIMIDNTNYYYSDYTYFPLFCYNNQSMASVASYHYKYCDSIFFDNDIRPLGIISSSKLNIPYEAVGITFDCPTYGKYLPINFKYPRGAYNNSELVYFGFGNEPVLYSINLANKKIRSNKIEFSSIEDISLSSQEYNMFFDYSQPEYLDIVYNPYTKQIFWFARLAVDASAPPICQNYPQYSFVVVNENLEKIGEGILPLGHQPPVIPLKNGFFVSNKMKSNENNKIIYSSFSLLISKNNSKSVDEMIYNQSNNLEVNQESLYKEYFEFVTMQNHGKFLLLPLDNSCITCLDKISNFFLKINTMNDLCGSLKIIIISNNEGKINSFVSSSKLMDYVGDNVYIDKNDKAKRYFVSWTNPRIITVDKKGLIVHDKIYNPSEIDQLLIEIKKE